MVVRDGGPDGGWHYLETFRESADTRDGPDAFWRWRETSLRKIDFQMEKSS